jgi:ketosteroid isomerase-like protein
MTLIEPQFNGAEQAFRRLASRPVPERPTIEDELALRALAAGYAAGVDRRDAERFLAVFTPEARLWLYDAGVHDEPRGVLHGTAELARVIERIAAYDRTFHFLGQSVYTVDGDEAQGEVHCIARHLTVDRHGAADFTMHIRYADTYRRDGGEWRIADRHVLVDWTEQQAANRPGSPQPKRTSS